MTEHRVFEVKLCAFGGVRCQPYPSNCSGCIGGGQRVDLDSGVAVEPSGAYAHPDHVTVQYEDEPHTCEACDGDGFMDAVSESKQVWPDARDAWGKPLQECEVCHGEGEDPRWVELWQPTPSPSTASGEEAQ